MYSVIFMHKSHISGSSYASKNLKHDACSFSQFCTLADSHSAHSAVIFMFGLILNEISAASHEYNHLWSPVVQTPTQCLWSYLQDPQ